MNENLILEWIFSDVNSKVATLCMGKEEHYNLLSQEEIKNRLHALKEKDSPLVKELVFHGDTKTVFIRLQLRWTSYYRFSVEKAIQATLPETKIEFIIRA